MKLFRVIVYLMPETPRSRTTLTFQYTVMAGSPEEAVWAVKEQHPHHVDTAAGIRIIPFAGSVASGPSFMAQKSHIPNGTVLEEEE